MCGRYTLKSDIEDLMEAFPGFDMPDDLTLRYNIAPTQTVPVIANDGKNKVAHFRWGLLPAWSKSASIGNRMINARAETLATKPSFRVAYRRRRCLVLADGFYEWRKEPGRKTKTPIYIQLADGRPFAFAGLWEMWQPNDAETLFTCTIITTIPNELIEPIHQRMPVILAPQDYILWLDVQERSSTELGALLKPYPALGMQAYPVSTRVNNPRFDELECVARLQE